MTNILLSTVPNLKSLLQTSSGLQNPLLTRLRMVDSLYLAYARIFRSIKDANGDLTSIFDTDNGFAPRLRVACQKVYV